MPEDRLTLALLRRLDAVGSRDALIGDLVEEIAAGRPRIWVYTELGAAIALALAGSVRRHVRLTPYVVALALAAVMLASVAVLPARSVLTTWLTCYYLAGMASLFAHMAAETQPRRREDTKGLDSSTTK